MIKITLKIVKYGKLNSNNYSPEIINKKYYKIYSNILKKWKLKIV